MATLTETREKFAAKQNEMAEVVAKARTDSGELDFSRVKEHGFDGLDSMGAVERLNAMNDELSVLGKEQESLASAAKIAEQVKARGDSFNEPAGGFKGSTSIPLHQNGGAGREMKSVGEAFTDSAGYKDWRSGREFDLDLQKDVGGGSLYSGVKTLMSTSAGWAPESIRTGRLVESAQRPVQVIDLIPSETTNQNAVKYMVETTFTNNAVEKAEGAAFGEAALALTEVTSPVQKIPVFLPVTDEQVEDVAYIQSFINNRLGFMVMQRLDGQVLVGDGNTPNLSGILDRASILTQAKGADPVMDAIFKARTKVRVTGRATPGALVIHGNDWQDIRLTRTADGIYILGNPTDPGPDRLWGLRVVESEALTEGTALVGDFAMHCGLAIRRNLTFKVSDSHSTYFVEGKQAIRVDMRCALQVYRETAFCTVTGI